METEKRFNGTALRERRLRAGLTTKALAEKCVLPDGKHLAESTIEGIEAGRRRGQMKDNTIIALAKALDCDPVTLEKEILGDEGANGSGTQTP